MRRIKLVLAVASMAVLLVGFSAPAMADDFNHNRFFDNPFFDNHFFFDPFFDNHFFDNHFFNDNGVFQANEQEVESGDSSQTFNVTGGGDNSNACQGIQGISNTGNAVNSTNVLQFDSFGEVEVDDSGNFEISPSSTTTCNQQVNQAASASG